ncbi:MAG: DUF4238 domain-containing protein [Gammaproteobacteria bacterium]|nr:DUF4238 domain-containing protein [Gammaproteobacteria bacterium]
MNNTKKRHHYLPKFYLDGFCDQQNMVWIYHKDTQKIHCQRPENTAIVKNFYAIHRNDGTIDTNTFEDALADIVESPAAAALKSLRLGSVPTDEYRQHLSILFAFMLVRTPGYRDSYEPQFNEELDKMLKLIAANEEYFQRWTDDYKKTNGVPLADNIEQLRQEILNGKFQVRVHPNFSLSTMQKLGFNCGGLLVNMKWVIIKAPKNLYFLTSDNPVIVTNPRGIGYCSPGLGLKDTRVFVPISKEVGLLMIRSDEDKLDNQIVSNNSKIVKEMNTGIVLGASKFIFANEQNDKITRLIKNVNEKIQMVNLCVGGNPIDI